MGWFKQFLNGGAIKHFTNNEEKGFFHKGKKYVHYTDLPANQSAFFRLAVSQKLFFIGFFAILILSLILNWKGTIIVVISLLTTVYFADLLFNLFLIIKSFSSDPEIEVSTDEVDAINEKLLPEYSILCPLYKEWQVLPQFVEGMSQLDYPKEKMQVMLLLEENDKQTIQKAREFDLPSNFEIVIVPDSKPKTKPKALNYGLKKARGKFIVVYDAEDVPEKNQLKKAIIAFEKAGKRVKCIQAKLNFYNPHQNVLTRIFTAEYSLWFDLVLTGLQSIHAPIPLGGTSNHFRKEDLHELMGWDAFNVTEDADLGMRIVKQGYRTAIINSTTREEANSSLSNWFWQRTRWIKGYMQTYFVHMRRPGEFLNKRREPHIITFQLVIGGKISSMLINPIMWILTIAYFLFRAKIGTTIESFFPQPIFYMGIFSLVFGNFLYMYYYMMGCSKRGQSEIVRYVFLVPFYWLVISTAAYVAAYKLVKEPHYWSKTKHGLHIAKQNENNFSLIPG